MARNSSADELDGPLFRIRTALVTSQFNPSTREWTETGMLPGVQFTLVKNGNVIDVQTNQPVLDVNDITFGALLRNLISAVKENL